MHDSTLHNDLMDIDPDDKKDHIKRVSRACGGWLSRVSRAMTIFAWSWGFPQVVKTAETVKPDVVLMVAAKRELVVGLGDASSAMRVLAAGGQPGSSALLLVMGVLVRRQGQPPSSQDLSR